MSDLEGRIAQIQKRLADAQKSLASEEAREFRDRQQAAKRAEEARKREQDKLDREHRAQMDRMNRELTSHSELHHQTQLAIARLSQVPETITVLFMASNPLDQQPLRLDEEARAIHEMIRMSKHRDVVKLETRWAVRSSDILQAINELDPAVLHFSGHGSEDDELVLQDAQGRTKLVSRDAIVAAIATMSSSIRLVFFNSCFSKEQAREVVKHIDAAIGMNTSIGDDAARIFAAQFYSGIGFGHSVDRAFKQARAALMLEGIPEEDTPELFVAEDVDPDALILVRPEDPAAHQAENLTD